MGKSWKKYEIYGKILCFLGEIWWSLMTFLGALMETGRFYWDCFGWQKLGSNRKKNRMDHNLSQARAGPRDIGLWFGGRDFGRIVQVNPHGFGVQRFIGPMTMFERKPAGIFWVWFQASPWILVAKEGKLDTSTSLLFLRLPFGTETSLWYQLWHPLSQGNSKRPLGSCRLACEWFPDSVVAATKNAAMTVVDQGDARSFSCKSTKKNSSRMFMLIGSKWRHSACRKKTRTRMFRECFCTKLVMSSL